LNDDLQHLSFVTLISLNFEVKVSDEITDASVEIGYCFLKKKSFFVKEKQTNFWGCSYV